MNKNQYKELFADFKKSHPLCVKSVLYWRPRGHECIEIWMKDGSIILYDGIKQKAIHTKETW